MFGTVFSISPRVRRFREHHFRFKIRDPSSRFRARSIQSGTPKPRYPLPARKSRMPLNARINFANKIPMPGRILRDRLPVTFNLGPKRFRESPLLLKISRHFFQKSLVLQQEHFTMKFFRNKNLHPNPRSGLFRTTKFDGRKRTFPSVPGNKKSGL